MQEEAVKLKVVKFPDGQFLLVFSGKINARVRARDEQEAFNVCHLLSQVVEGVDLDALQRQFLRS